MSDQQPEHTPTFVTQRDGSALANSNCRMASICMGLDYETLGGERSTGAKMRSYTSDQSGGTDAGDAREAWDRGYNESLDIEDGKTFDNALSSLRDGRMVHLDVWHATVGGSVCVSGSGAYGHTVAIVPDCLDGKWLVGDPWCTSGFKRVSESKLRAGAEEWGRRVYGAAAMEADYPSESAGPRDPIVLAIVSRIVKRFMGLSYPEHERVLPYFPDTGGAQPILYTATRAQPLEGSDMVKFTPGNDVAGTLTVIRDTAGIPVEGGDRPSVSAGIMRPALGMFTLDDLDDRLCYLMGVGNQLCFIAAADVTFVPDDGPNSGTGGDIEQRDAEWAAWLLEGSPGS